MKENSNLEIEKINKTYTNNIENVTKILQNIGINTMIADGEYKSLNTIISELLEKWEILSIHENRFIQDAVCTSIAGIRNRNSFILLMDRLFKGVQ